MVGTFASLERPGQEKVCWPVVVDPGIPRLFFKGFSETLALGFTPQHNQFAVRFKHR